MHQRSQQNRQHRNPSPIRPGLYHVVLEPPADGDTFPAYAPSSGVILQYKASFGYFTLPGASREPMAYLVDPAAAATGTILVEFTEDALVALCATFSTPHRQRLAKPYWPKRSRYERDKDAHWSKVAKLRNAGESFRHLFGETETLESPVKATFKPAVSDLCPQPTVEVDIIEIFRPGVGWLYPVRQQNGRAA